jgi:non-specific serine/threonine protein kinase/serine/threonine-protein kinase
VQHAHQKAVIHRDLKPSNILVGELDGKPLPRIIDFGLAKATSQRLTAQTMFTRIGSIVGTPGYMSPEQADSAGEDIDTRTDVYSLGVVLYELLAGALPLDFHNLRFDEVVHKLREQDASKPSTKLRTLGEQSTTAARNRRTEPRILARQLRGDLDAITLKALEKERSRRYGSPADLAADIGRYLRNEPVLARPAGAGYRARKYLRRHQIGVAVAATAAVLLVSVAVAQAFELRRITRERDRADRITAFMTGMFSVSNPSEARGNKVTAREILDKASKDIGKGLGNDPELQAQLMQVMGHVYRELGIYPEAESLLRHTVEIRRRTLGVNNPDTARSMFDLAQVLTFESRYAEAEKSCRETTDTFRRALGLESRDTLFSMNWLAWILYSEGRYPEAEKLNRQVLAAATRVFGPQDRLSRVVQGHLTLSIFHEGKYAEAEKALREELGEDRHTFGPDNRQVIADSNNLGEVLSREGKFAAAEEMYREALQAYLRVYGPEYPFTLDCTRNLGSVLSSERSYPEAEKLFRDALEIQGRVLGPEHAETLVTMGNLADALTEEGRYAEAEQLLRQTLETKRRTLGLEHAVTLDTLDDLGKLLKRERRYPAAEKAFRETLEGRRRALAPGDPKTASTAYDLACVLALEVKRGESFANLRYAVEHPLPAETRLGLEKESDLKSLHGDPRFALLVASARQPEPRNRPAVTQTRAPPPH